jgi:hypothetical protein
MDYIVTLLTDAFDVGSKQPDESHLLVMFDACLLICCFDGLQAVNSCVIMFITSAISFPLARKDMFCYVVILLNHSRLGTHSLAMDYNS